MEQKFPLPMPQRKPMLQASYHTIVGLCADGTVCAVGKNENHQCEVSHWRDMVSVLATEHHTIGLREDGTVHVAEKHTLFKGEYAKTFDTRKWQNMVAIAADDEHLVGLQANGRCQVTGVDWDRSGIDQWSHIVSVHVSEKHVVGLRAEGQVRSLSLSPCGKDQTRTWKNICKVFPAREQNAAQDCNGRMWFTHEFQSSDGWEDLVDYQENFHYAYGLRRDGRVVMRVDLEELWLLEGAEQVTAMAAELFGLICLHADGTVSFYPEDHALWKDQSLKRLIAWENLLRRDLPQWRDVVQICCSGFHVLGLKADGSVLYTGTENPEYTQVRQWNLGPVEMPEPKPEPNPAPTGESWTCAECGAAGLTTAFCTECGAKKPEPKSEPVAAEGWTCAACGATGLTTAFCTECGAKKPEPKPEPVAAEGWTCAACGATGLTTAFCTECGIRKPGPQAEKQPVPVPEPEPIPEPDPIPEPEPVTETWACPVCGAEALTGNFCNQCGAKKPEPKPAAERWTCTACGATDLTGNFCNQCGAPRPVVRKDWTCPVCGKKDLQNAFCDNCGAKRP